MSRTTIQEVATLYCTNRREFTDKYGETLHADYLDMLFVKTTTRPDLAEDVTILTLGGQPKTQKHGFDGTLASGRKIEAKITCSHADSNARSGAVTINDPSENIIHKYDKNNPLFVFSYFYNGELLAIFGVEWNVLRPLYVEGVRKINEVGKGRRNFTISPSAWCDNCEVLFVNKTADMSNMKPKSLREKAEFSRRGECA